jgi:hypothetical protein
MERLGLLAQKSWWGAAGDSWGVTGKKDRRLGVNIPMGKLNTADNANGSRKIEHRAVPCGEKAAQVAQTDPARVANARSPTNLGAPHADAGGSERPNSVGIAATGTFRVMTDPRVTLLPL